MRKAETEGKIKGPARLGPLSQSARGLRTARRPVAPVPREYANPDSAEARRVPYAFRCAALRWSLGHAIAWR